MEPLAQQEDDGIGQPKDQNGDHQPADVVHSGLQGGAVDLLKMGIETTQRIGHRAVGPNIFCAVQPFFQIAKEIGPRPLRLLPVGHRHATNPIHDE